MKPAKRIEKVEEYYFSKKLKQIAQMNSQGKNVINLGIGSPDLPPSAETIDVLAREALRPDVHAYQSYIGIPLLREAYAHWYEKFYGVKLSAVDEILPLMGSKEGIFHISMAFLNPGDKVLIPNPGYPTYTSVCNIVGAVPVPYTLDESNGWYPDFKALETNGLEGVKMMWVNYPHMPTGTPAKRDVLEQIVAFGKKHNILICNDNPYSFILNNNPLSIMSVEGAKDVALELNSLSKSHNMAGWRMGMIAGSAEHLSYVLRVKSNMDSGMFKPMQIAAAEALSAGTDWFYELNTEYRARRVLALDILKKIGTSLDEAQVGMFLWAKISDNWQSGEELTDYILEKANVFITPGIIFGSQGEKYIRLSLCSNKKMLQEAKERIESVL